MRISDWSSDVCSSDLRQNPTNLRQPVVQLTTEARRFGLDDNPSSDGRQNPTNLRQPVVQLTTEARRFGLGRQPVVGRPTEHPEPETRSEERRVGKECVRRGRTRCSQLL